MKKNNFECKNSNIKEDATQELASSLPKNIQRKCIACNGIFDRSSMIRVLKSHNTSEFIIEPDNKQFGRSFYICKNIECLKIAMKKKRFQKIMKTHFSEEFIEKMKNKILN